MEIAEIRAFVAVARERSFSLAARKLFRTQPTVSMAVRKLEREVGVRLLDRSGRGVRPTPSGEIFLADVGPLLEAWEASRMRVRESADGVPWGNVRVAGEEAAILYLLAGPLRAYLKRCPQVEPILRCGEPAEAAKALRSGEVDFCIGSFSPSPAEFEYRPFARNDRMLIAPRTLSLPRGGRLTVSRLAAFPLILPLRGSPLRQHIERAFEKAGAAPRAVLEASSWETVKQYVGLGLGIAIVPGFCLQRTDRRLTARSARQLFGQDIYGLLFKRGRALSAAAHQLAREIHTGFPVSRGA
jgi:DNA-binding transcriptional LysR family regulator